MKKFFIYGLVVALVTILIYGILLYITKGSLIAGLETFFILIAVTVVVLLLGIISIINFSIPAVFIVSLAALTLVINIDFANSIITIIVGCFALGLVSAENKIKIIPGIICILAEIGIIYLGFYVLPLMILS